MCASLFHCPIDISVVNNVWSRLGATMGISHIWPQIPYSGPHLLEYRGVGGGAWGRFALVTYILISLFGQDNSPIKSVFTSRMIPPMLSPPHSNSITYWPDGNRLMRVQGVTCLAIGFSHEHHSDWVV